METLQEETEVEAQMRRDLAVVFRVCARNNWNENLGNHLSVSLPGEEGLFLVNPRGKHFRQIRAQDLIVCDLDGNTVRGSGKIRPVAFHVHARIHRAHPNAGVLLHVHSPYATALSGLDKFRFGRVFNSNLLLNERIVYDDAKNGSVNGIEEGDRLASLLGNKSILFMASHGVLVAGSDIASTFYELCMFERMCMNTVHAMSTGRPLRDLPETLLIPSHAALKDYVDPDMHMAAWHEMLSREEPEYCS